MDYGYRALTESIEKLRFNFDDRTYTIRRNLMISSSLAIASTFLSPLESEGKYEVNLGVIKGVVESPVHLYLFLAVVCIYYLFWFHLHCKKLVVGHFNSQLSSFISSLARINAEDKFKEFIKNNNILYEGGTSFESKIIGVNRYTVRGVLKKSYGINHFKSMVDKLKEDSEFVISDVADGINIEYTHECSINDLAYLNCHVDLCWRRRKVDMFVATLPILYSILALFLILWHISSLVDWDKQINTINQIIY